MVYYKSIATGRYYWSLCAGSSAQWEPIGNSVVIIKQSEPNCTVAT
jgi:hypothetical protein